MVIFSCPTFRLSWVWYGDGRRGLEKKKVRMTCEKDKNGRTKGKEGEVGEGK